MASILFTGTEMSNLVIGLELLIIGTIGLILVYLLSRKRPRRVNTNVILYILMMTLVFYAIFYLKDPFEFLPQDFWNVVNLVIVFFTIFGFYRMLANGIRSEVNKRLDDFRNEVNTRFNDFRNEIRRDFDRLEKRLEKIQNKL